MISANRTVLLVAGLSLLGVVTHLLPHSLGISTVGAISMIAAAYLRKGLILVPVLVTVGVVDAINGFYDPLAMVFVWLAYALGALSIAPVLTRVRLHTVFAAAVINGVVFYVVSSISHMLLEFYPNTLQGWIACYADGLPFMMRGVFANLVFGGIAFGLVALLRRLRAHHFAPAER